MDYDDLDEVNLDQETLDKIKRTVAKVVEMLVNKDYPGIERISKGDRVDGEQIKGGVEEYGCTLISPPEGAYDKIDIIPSVITENRYGIDFRLYTEEEGRSDLEIRMSLIDQVKEADTMIIIFEDILVP